jgi:tungstate transport system permease protein
LILNLNSELIRIILLTFKVSGLALLLSSALGVPMGAIIGLRKFPLRGIVISLLNAFMGLPPVLAGLFLYIILSRSAMVAAQFVLALPIVASLTHSAVVGVDPAIRLAARSLGAAPYQVTLTVIKEGRYGIMSGVIAAFGRVMAEIGAVLIVGGNIKGYTRVMTTTIALEADKGDFELAIALGMILLAISIIINLALHSIQKKARS